MKPHRIRTTAAVVAAAALLAACGGPSEPELLASARDYVEKKDYPAAVIQLKSALQANAESAEARYLLGKTLLAQGKTAEAVVELRKAAELRFDENRVAPALARALLDRGGLKDVIDAYGAVTLKDAAANADLRTTVALAYAAQDKRDLAEKAMDEALAAAPAYARAKVLKARFTATRQDFAGAVRLLDEVTAAEPGNGEAWLFKAEIQQRALRDNQAALAAYRQAAQADPNLMAAHQGVVGLLVQARDIAGADAYVAELKRKLPEAGGTRLLDAQMAYLKGDWARTRELVQPLMQAAPNNPMVLQLAGAAEFQLRALTQAETYLAAAIKFAPNLAMARALLAQTQLRTGQPDKALETLRPALDTKEPMPEMLSLAGEAWLQKGDIRRAEEAFTRVARARPEDPRARTALALSQIGRGNAAQGIAELQAVAAADKGVVADMALITAQLRRREFDAALKAIDNLERKQADKPLAANLRGRVQMLKQDPKAARASFERALAIDPVFFPAVASLAALDLTEKKPEAARKRFDDLLKAEPKNHQAMMAIASLLSRTGGSPQEIRSQLEAAVMAAPAEAAPRLQLIGHLLSMGEPKAAMSVAQTAVAALPDNRDLLAALGRTQLASQDFQQAVSSFNKLAQMAPSAPGAPLGLADAYLGLKDYSGAERSLKRALELAPNLLQAQRGLISLMASDGRYNDALAVAREVQKQRPTEPIGHHLEGDIEQQRRNWDAALAAHRAGLAKSKAGGSAVEVHTALVAAGRKDEADKFAAGWLNGNPKDALFRFYQGDAALAAKDWATAEARYRDVLQVQPANAMALNNVAWLLLKQGKPGAMDYATKANEALPNNPVLMDTLAMAMAADNQAPKALELQKRAVERAPDNNELRLNLARLYIKTGDKKAARSELERLEKLGTKFVDHAEVAQLLKSV